MILKDRGLIWTIYSILPEFANIVDSFIKIFIYFFNIFYINEKYVDTY